MVHSVKSGPLIAEYSVSGTTYAPEGIIFDSSATQVIIPEKFSNGCIMHALLLPRLSLLPCGI